MIIELDTEFLLDNFITAHQFLIAKLIYEEKFKLLENYITASGSLTDIYKDLAALTRVGFLDSIHNPGSIVSYKDIKVSKKFKERFSFAVDPFDEFYNLYPTKVVRKDGTHDYLRVDREMCRKIYHNLIRTNVSLHERIVRSLKAEIDDRTKRGGINYMRRMSTWLSSEAWKAYDNSNEYGLESTLEDNSVAYGTAIE